MELTDESIMPFGKHKGKTMAEVPASYLFYLWTNGMEHDTQSDVANYIRSNLDVLQMDYPDGEW